MANHRARELREKKAAKKGTVAVHPPKGKSFTTPRLSDERRSKMTRLNVRHEAERKNIVKDIVGILGALSKRG